ncbi:hypothetical protein BRYFOR_05581 [Marvinbryantia formatexigens DSM 14469]|uniref:Uncharacterized protein n=1 Tax=Marvinbryantia formatexigens DSM 14469 TaxID=478749 RepID=C6LAD9_9FIRM|nr:hypothetical protein [Marvinbryantia formatexigens]EET62546.1 hypothetical protein BRYFOR_05581 [Marvinbryantia formatexigens DSM 14469]UWO24933.1 hypothetical protein NQ534_00085 [Marvinbryantia formatexigens DSM 14469]SDG24324.1 hypothetical protein SAMN05660368_02160 [Marvinbryantia formatexigens]
MGWESFYNITFLQEYLLIAVGGYVGCLFADSLAMLASAKTKSAVIAVLVPCAVIFIPPLLNITPMVPAVEKLIGILPHQLVQIYSVINGLYIYQAAGRYTGAVEILLVLYPVLCIALLPATYMIFRRGEEKSFASPR